VPLSRAICCRPCLPSSLPPDEDDRSQTPLAVVSLGCHASIDTLGVRCEQSAGSFVSGFTDAVRVFTAADTVYPIDTAQCCTPALLLESGDAWELERCDCHPSDDATYPVNCGGNSTHEGLAGFDYFRLTPMGQVVPVGPAKCCSVCLSDSVHRMSKCADLNHCNNKGVCLLGRCECLVGWGGSDCSLPVGKGGRYGGRIPPWGIALIVIGSCLLAIVLLSVVAHIAERIADARSGDGDSEDGDESRRPLLLRIDPDDCGSVGSTDTECDDVDVEEVEERIEGVIHRIEGQGTGAEGGEGSPPEGTGQAPEAADQPEAAAATGDSTAENGVRVRRSVLGVPVPEVFSPSTEESPSPEDAQRQEGDLEAGGRDGNGSLPTGDGGEVQPEEKGAGPLQSYTGVGPLSNVDCIVCMIRPVQTVVVPCGHVCMCRRCSRRLNRCPICRKDIARRQRLFV